MLLVVSCADNSEVGLLGRAQVLVCNMVPEDDSVTLYLDTTVVNNSPLSFNELSPYDTLAAGRRSVIVKSYTTDSVVMEKAMYINPYRNYSFFIVPMDSINKQISLVATVDYLSLPQTMTNAKVRFIHLAPKELGVNLYTKLDTFTERKTFTNAYYKTASVFQELKAGKYTLRLTDVQQPENQISTVTNVVFEQKKSYTILISGLKNSTDYPQQISVIQNN